jgi:hypothetical protein
LRRTFGKARNGRGDQIDTDKKDQSLCPSERQHFIAYARQDIPRLIAEIERLKKLV